MKITISEKDANYLAEKQPSSSLDFQLQLQME